MTLITVNTGKVQHMVHAVVMAIPEQSKSIPLPHPAECSAAFAR